MYSRDQYSGSPLTPVCPVPLYIFAFLSLSITCSSCFAAVRVREISRESTHFANSRSLPRPVKLDVHITNSCIRLFESKVKSHTRDNDLFVVFTREQAIVLNDAIDSLDALNDPAYDLIESGAASTCDTCVRHEYIIISRRNNMYIVYLNLQ